MLVKVVSPLDEFQENLKDRMESVEGLELDGIEYIDNNHLHSYIFRQTPASHARYVLSDLESNDNSERITESIEPIGLQARAEMKISTGFLSSHTHYVDLYVLNIDRMKQLANGGDPKPRMSEFKAEVLPDFCDPDHEAVIEYYWELENWLRRIDSY